MNKVIALSTAHNFQQQISEAEDIGFNGESAFHGILWRHIATALSRVMFRVSLDEIV
ncbi:hypothetical protein LINPERHAP1_LOCUS20378 [Linum perenne]